MRGTQDFADYWSAMDYCVKWARINRERIVSSAVSALEKVVGSSVIELDEFDTRHNFAAQERLGGGSVGIVHRKGAVRARGRVTIPGSMGTATAVGVGLDNPDSWGSCSHGAGRVMSRGQAKRSDDQVLEWMRRMKECGISVISAGSVADELPFAYKDIQEVMAWQEDLVELEDWLIPMAVLKG